VPEGVPVRREGPPGQPRQERPRYLRWALIEAATHTARHPVYAERYKRTSTRLGRQRGKKIATDGSCKAFVGNFIDEGA
jgi:hypothetical protein